MGLRNLLSHPHPRDSASGDPQSTTLGKISEEEEADWTFLSQWSTKASPARLQRGPRSSGNVLGMEQNPFANIAGHLSYLKVRGVYIYASHIPALSQQPCHQERNPPSSQNRWEAMRLPHEGLGTKGGQQGPLPSPRTARKGPPAAVQQHPRSSVQCAMFMGGPNCKQGPDAGSDWTKSLVLSASFI